MRSFALLAAIAAIASAAEECLSTGNADDCWTDSSIKDAIAAGTDQYTWARYETTTADDYNLGLIRLVGDNAGDAFVAAEDAKGPVLLLHTAFSDCLDWLNSDDPAIDSIPLQLAKSGFDVWLGCRRGTFLSRTHQTLDADDDAEEYWNFDTQTVGENDTPAMVQKIKDEAADASSCVQIVNHSFSTAEVLSYLAAEATADETISQVINLAACAIPTYQLGGVLDEGDDRRMLEGDAPEDVRNLHALVEEDVKVGRELGHRWYLSESYWARTEAYCEHHPDSCRRYCDYYPYYCDQFCERFPEFCVPDDIQNYYNFLDLVRAKGIYSFYGPNWEDQVDRVCHWVGNWSHTCISLRASLDKGYKEMSVKQLEHLWQVDYTESFARFNEDFLENGWIEDPDVIDISGVTVQSGSAYVPGDATCDPEINQTTLASLSPFYSEFTDESITHSNVNTANDNATLLTYLNVNLLAKANSCINEDD